MDSELSAINAETAENWEWFATHRAHVTELITRACGSRAERVAVLGAGNCNDIDLPEVLKHADGIALMDVDGAALAHGVVRQCVDGSDRITLHGGVDVTGAWDCIRRWSGRQASPEQIEEYRRRIGTVAPIPLAGECDVAVSSCLLCPLISRVVRTLGAEHAQTLDLVTRLRDQHLLVLARQVRPGGRALLVSDLVSSDTCPELLHAPDTALRSLLGRVLAERNFFTGANPIVAIDRLRVLMPGELRDVRLIGPWRWRLSDARAYLVYALAFTRIRPAP